MKKLFTIMALALCSLASIADEYTCPYKVLVTGMNPVTGEMTVNVDKQSNNKYTLSIKNFALNAAMKVGNIVVNDVDGLVCGNTTALSTQQVIQITSGDGNAEEWMGPTLGNVPILMKAEICNNKLNAILNIDMSKMLQNVSVMLGENIDNFGQIPNSDFEDFHDAKYGSATSREPNHWHSFMSATGTYASIVANTPHTFESTDHPTDSKNGKSVQIKSANVAGQSANGTLTTGRLNAGSIIASSSDNNAFLDLSNEDEDENKDPFYTVLTCKPDEMKVNLKYNIGERGRFNKNKYATVKAIITNGNKVQDPELKANNGNVVARAENATIESSEDWQTLSIPFTYTDNEIDTKAILVTISTSSVAAGGSTNSSKPDIVWVDNVELVYNADLESATYKGEPIEFDDNNEAEVSGTGIVNLDDFEVKTKSPNAYVSKTVRDYQGNAIAAITVTSNDLKTANVYYVFVEGGTTGIKGVQSSIAKNGVKAIYNLAGQQVGSMTPGQVYIVKTTDGQTKKVVKK